MAYFGGLILERILERILGSWRWLILGTAVLKLRLVGEGGLRPWCGFYTEDISHAWRSPKRTGAADCSGQARVPPRQFVTDGCGELEEGARSFRTWCGLGRTWSDKKPKLSKLSMCTTAQRGLGPELDDLVVTWRGLEGEKPFWRGYSFADISSVHFTVWGSILDNLGSFSASGAALRTLLDPSG